MGCWATGSHVVHMRVTVWPSDMSLCGPITELRYSSYSSYTQQRVYVIEKINPNSLFDGLLKRVKLFISLLFLVSLIMCEARPCLAMLSRVA